MPPLRHVQQYDPPSQKVLDDLKAYVVRHLLAAEAQVEWRHDLDPQFDVARARPYIATYDMAYEFENDRHGGNVDPGLAILLAELEQRGIVKPLSAEQQAELVASDQRRNPRGTRRPDSYKTAWEVLSLDAAIQYWPDAFK